MARTIGVLGGISPASTGRYYEMLVAGHLARHGDHHYPRIVINSLDFQRFTDYENADDREGYLDYIAEGIAALGAAGADFAIMAANSPHAVYDDLLPRVDLPLLSIVEPVVAAASRLRLERLLLLGIRFTMRADFYPRALQRAGIAVTIPSAADQEEIDGIVFDQLSRNIFRPDTRRRLVEIVDKHAVDGVILGCTELPLILTPGDLGVPALDTLALHAGAALEWAYAAENAQDEPRRPPPDARPVEGAH